MIIKLKLPSQNSRTETNAGKRKHSKNRVVKRFLCYPIMGGEWVVKEIETYFFMIGRTAPEWLWTDR